MPPVMHVARGLVAADQDQQALLQQLVVARAARRRSRRARGCSSGRRCGAARGGPRSRARWYAAYSPERAARRASCASGVAVAAVPSDQRRRTSAAACRGPRARRRACRRSRSSAAARRRRARSRSSPRVGATLAIRSRQISRTARSWSATRRGVKPLLTRLRRLPVLRVVHVDHRRDRRRVGPRCPPLSRQRLVVLRHRHDVLVQRDAPDLARLVPVHRRVSRASSGSARAGRRRRTAPSSRRMSARCSCRGMRGFLAWRVSPWKRMLRARGSPARFAAFLVCAFLIEPALDFRHRSRRERRECASSSSSSSLG